MERGRAWTPTAKGAAVTPSVVERLRVAEICVRAETRVTSGKSKRYWAEVAANIASASADVEACARELRGHTPSPHWTCKDAIDIAARLAAPEGADA
jgi:hypothetical protein